MSMTLQYKGRGSLSFVTTKKVGEEEKKKRSCVIHSSFGPFTAYFFNCERKEGKREMKLMYACACQYASEHGPWEKLFLHTRGIERRSFGRVTMDGAE